MKRFMRKLTFVHILFRVRVTCILLRLSYFIWLTGCMGRFISRWIVLTIAVAVTVSLLPGLTVVGEPPVLGMASFALFMALINASIKPIVHLLALPFSILSFGFVSLIINWMFMQFASFLALSVFGVGVIVDGFWWSVFASLIMSIVSSIVGTIIGE